jgi:hypothetical protein
LKHRSVTSSVAPQVPISVKPKTRLFPGAALFSNSVVYCFVASGPEKNTVSGKLTQMMVFGQASRAFFTDMDAASELINELIDAELDYLPNFK